MSSKEVFIIKVISCELPQFDELRIFPLSDCHFEDAFSNHKKLLEWRQQVLSSENNYVVINGDIINAATKNSKSDIYSSTDNPDGALDAVAEFLQPLVDEGRILAIVDGNHEARIYKESGVKPMRRLAKELGIVDKYAPDAYILFVSFGLSQGRTCRKMVYSIYGRHGSGGGKKVGGKANALVDMEAVIDADIYIAGHTHQPMIIPRTFTRCDYRNKKITYVEKMFINTNAFLTYGGYGEVGGFTPPSIRWPIIILNGHERKINTQF